MPGRTKEAVVGVESGLPDWSLCGIRKKRKEKKTRKKEWEEEKEK